MMNDEELKLDHAVPFFLLCSVYSIVTLRSMEAKL